MILIDHVKLKHEFNFGEQMELIKIFEMNLKEYLKKILK